MEKEELAFGAGGKPHVFQMIGIILKSLREYKGKSIGTLVAVFFQAILDCSIPLVIGLMLNGLNAMNQSGDTSHLMALVGPYAGILIAMAACSFVMAFLGAKLSAEAAIGLATNLRHDIFYQTTRFSFENIDRFSKASLVTRLTTDVFNIWSTYMQGLRLGLMAVVTMVYSVVASMVIGLSLSWIYAVTIPLVVLGSLALMSVAMKIYFKALPMFDKINKDIEENVRGIRTIKTYTREDYERFKFKGISDSIKKLMTKGEILAGMANPLMTAIMNISISLFVGVGAFAMLSQTIKTGDFSALVNFGVNVLMALMNLAMIMVMIAISLASMQRVCQILVEKPTIANPIHGLKDVPDGSIGFRHVHFRYDAKSGKAGKGDEALKGIDLSIPAGQTVGIIGGTGSSKSTLVNMIPRFYDPQSGEVEVGGHNVKEYDTASLREAVAMVLQKNVLFGGTLRENMQWGDPTASDEAIEKALELSQAKEFVDKLPGGLDYMVEQGGTNFSGGQKQRLCIARAILKHPKILILDDSTSAVDTKTDAKIREGLKAILPGTTKIIIAQRISSVADADQVVVMAEGTIQAKGTPKDLYRSSRVFKEISDMQGIKEDQLR